LKYRLIVRASPSAEVKQQIAQKYSQRCGCGSSYHQASACPWGPEGWKEKYTNPQPQPQPTPQLQQFAVVTPSYNGGVVQQQHPVQALGIQKKIQTHAYVSGSVVQPQQQVVFGGGIICQQTGTVFVQAMQQPRIYCRARGCNSCVNPGQVHYCGNCGDNNSDHLTQDCRIVRIYCRARGCTNCVNPGQKHRCKKCGDTNSNHRTKDCRAVIAPVGKSPVVINGVLYWL